MNAISDFISLQHPTAADRIVERIHGGVERLRSFPESGRMGRIEGTRELIVHPNYVVVYRVTEVAVVILRVLHARQRYP